VTDDQQEAFDERAAILEFDAGMNRSEAELLAAQMVCEDAEAEFMMGTESKESA
jgi:hypothetical protein